ncbi:hypothetical protein [Moritella yayanosii]|uniref:Uncharacterized protein n=1 Tax=Moritella yayanosii TaxID=69539 RepID=A0A330LS57_9GAMM|nr:hypothetical protein [Moritella yayanosii]SQD79553.1 protein of unknown function [Moritella yayanosii]
MFYSVTATKNSGKLCTYYVTPATTEWVCGGVDRLVTDIFNRVIELFTLV